MLKTEAGQKGKSAAKCNRNLHAMASEDAKFKIVGIIQHERVYMRQRDSFIAESRTYGKAKH